MKNIKELLKNKYLKSGIGFTVATLLLRAIGFISTPIFSRLMEPRDYGLYNTYLSYEAILYLFVGLALHSSIQNALYDFKEKLTAYISSVILLVCFNTVFLIIIGNIIYPVIFPYFQYSRSVLCMLILHSFSTSIIQIMQAYLVISYNYKKYLMISTFNAVGNIVISVFLILTLYQENRSFARTLGNFIPVLIIALIIIYYFIKKAPLTYNKIYWRYGLKFSLPIVPHGLSQIILNQFDRIMIQTIIGAEAAGLYGFGFTISAIASTVTGALQNVFTPWFYKRMDEGTKEAYDVLKEKSTLYITLLFGMISALICIVPELLRLLGPESYSQAKYVAVPILVGLFFSVLYTLPVNVEYYYKKTGYIAAATTIVAILNIVLNMIFIPQFGYIAAAYTTIISYAVYFIFHYFLAYRFHGKDLFSLKTLVFLCIGNILTGISSLFFIDYVIARCCILFIICLITLKPVIIFIKENTSNIQE